MLASLVLVSDACECASRTADLTSAHKVTTFGIGLPIQPLQDLPDDLFTIQAVML